MVAKAEMTKAEAEKVEETKQDGTSRFSRTGVQAGLAGALVIILSWVLKMIGVDMDPETTSMDMPIEVSTAWTILFTALGSYLMNLKAIRGK